MIEARYIHKNRDNQNRIISYVLEDKNGQQITMSSRDLKNNIIQDKIRVLNLVLTSDNRLVDSSDKAFDKYRGTNIIVRTSEVPQTDLNKALEKIVKALGLEYNIENVSSVGTVINGMQSGVQYLSNVIETQCFGNIAAMVSVYREHKNNGQMSKNDLLYSVTVFTPNATTLDGDEHDSAFAIECVKFNFVSLKFSVDKMGKTLQRLRLDRNFYKQHTKEFAKMISYLYKNKTFVDNVTKDQFANIFANRLLQN